MKETIEQARSREFNAVWDCFFEHGRANAPMGVDEYHERYFWAQVFWGLLRRMLGRMS